MKKRVLSLLLAVAMILTMVPMKAQAATATGNTAPAGTAEGLYFRYSPWDDINQVHYEDVTKPLQNAITLSPNSGTPVYFYYVDANLNEYKLLVEDLTIQNTSVAKLWNETEWVGAVALHCVGFGTSQISYRGFSITMTGVLPEVGYYSAPTASQANYITDMHKITNADNKVYFIATNGWYFTNLQLLNDFADIADVSLSADKTCATITLKKEFWTAKTE